MPTSRDLGRDGYLGPVRLFTPFECIRIASYLRRDDLPAPSVWPKGRAVHERFLYDLATSPAILDRVTDVLGENVVLWGADAVHRRPGDVHAWHSDIESCGPESGFVSVWIGIENTSRDSSLQLISGSHRLGKSVQEARAARGIGRGEASPGVLLAIARATDPAARLVVPDMGDGDAIFFDGRLWHGTDNRRRKGARLALLFQFAASDQPVRIPDLSVLDWPFRLFDDPKPPVIVVRGNDRQGPNRLVPPPPRSSADEFVVDTAIHHFELPLGQERPAEPWRMFPAFRGATRTCADMSCHASVLAGGHTPHPPIGHAEEEILVALHGEVEVIIPSGPANPTPRSERLTPGSFVYYPGGQPHTIRNPGSSPVGYVVFKWRGPAADGGGDLGTEIVRFGDASPAGDEPFSSQLLLEGPTSSLGKLHAHLTALELGAGYEPHRDAYDVAIVTFDGTVETLGERVEPWSVVYYGAGELHGLRNVGADPARYLVFEFHARQVETGATPPGLPRRIGSRAVRAARRLAPPLRRS